MQGTRHRLSLDDERVRAFWRERRVCTLVTVRPDGTPHAVPVGATLDAAAGLVRVITSAGSAKARHVRAAGDGGLPVAVSQVDGRYWVTVEGRAVLRSDAASVADAERRYAERYKPPRENPQRVVIEIAVGRVLGNV
ncbi:pyridoxamine 5'-phosphate oxidase family protein [Actinomadura opuntiae]|uniref:pyridoxamine 5'-phosphate oxidase family protein n=1 Tax=Actinomadura sp. OS1-43 TaxID=604315 RepID=UPI00255AB7A4|nr:TIGR03618 family F420-dependent PPOX class oxidoreductase [Actinomadura sp. OS1-43]MDL4817518.1 TIGR03618 family F420-dependent PPOX class oxidoreductase [Actinomadura sp. OS1-43]